MCRNHEAAYRTPRHRGFSSSRYSFALSVVCMFAFVGCACRELGACSFVLCSSIDAREPCPKLDVAANVCREAVKDGCAGSEAFPQVVEDSGRVVKQEFLGVGAHRHAIIVHGIPLLARVVFRHASIA